MGFIVTTLVDGIEVDSQAVNDATELKDNNFVVFNKESELSVNGGDVFKGGTDGSVDGSAHEKARNAFETISCNIVAVPTTDKEIQDAYIAYVKRQRDEYGIKFQIVLPSIEREAPINHEGVISYVNEVANPVKDKQSDLCYWLAGAEAGVPVQSSITAKYYDGNFTVKANATRADQTKAIRAGEILFHKVGDDVVILRDINTFTKVERGDEEKKSTEFSSNQVIRVLDGITTETARIFNTYFLGKRGNTSLQRAELRNQLLRIRETYEQIGAIDEYDPTTLVINRGAKPNEVVGSDGIRPVQAMDTLYFTIIYVSD